jgi:hypothetical protein
MQNKIAKEMLLKVIPTLGVGFLLTYVLLKSGLNDLIVSLVMAFVITVLTLENKRWKSRTR